MTQGSDSPHPHRPPATFLPSDQPQKERRAPLLMTPSRMFARERWRRAPIHPTPIGRQRPSYGPLFKLTPNVPPVGSSLANDGARLRITPPPSAASGLPTSRPATKSPTASTTASRLVRREFLGGEAVFDQMRIGVFEAGSSPALAHLVAGVDPALVIG